MEKQLYAKLISDKPLKEVFIDSSISEILFEIRVVSDEMRAEENRIIEVRRSDYNNKKVLAPIFLLILGVFALTVFVLSFLRLYKNKQRIKESEAFLSSVVEATDNIINYYEPVYNAQRTVVDFTIVFANKGNKEHLGLNPSALIGKHVSTIFPFLKLNGEFQDMVTCFNTKKKIFFDRQISMHGKPMWFKTVLTPHANGILVTARNATVEEQAKSQQLVLREQILEDNEKLIETESFLNSILANTDNVISYLKPIYSATQELIDFFIEFNNDSIENVLNKQKVQIEKKLLSEAFPIYFTNGVFIQFKACFEKGVQVKFEKKYTFEGITYWFKSSSVKMNAGILVTDIDITEEKTLAILLKKQNTLLKENRAFLSNIFKSISDVVMHFKSIRNAQNKIIDFKIQFLNEQISAVTGDIPSEVKNKKVSEVYPSIFESGVFDNLVKAIEDDTAVDYEVPYHDGKNTIWFRATAIRLGDGVTVTTRDITEEKETSEQLLHLNEQLQTQNSILTEAEDVAKIGSYRWSLDTNQEQLSNNFFKILGEKPNSMDVTLTKVRNFVHPEDLEIYDRIDFERNNTKTKVDSFRIITKKGAIKNIYVKGKINEKYGRPISVGIIQDVTDQLRRTEDLSTSNAKLIRSNSELEAFNRVASHDLQEPLRKIQMFISRISEDGSVNLPQRTFDYFKKIDNAANRMQSLIVNLLTYSRIDGRHEDFVEVSLNEVLEKAQEGLSSTLESTHGKVIYKNLPTIKGVFYQLEQLFSNLISNSLKYRKEDQPPLIYIHSEKVEAAEISEIFLKVSSHYQKITFKDHGIGFEEEYNEKVFEVFQRLHGKSEYTGTGIGLSICKKIIENHHGYIYARGEVDKGATFIFYLPV